MKPEIIEGDINDLKPLADNPMRHGKRNKETTLASLKEFGFSRSIVAHQNSDGTKTILAGHGTLDASKEAGIDKVVYVPVDGDTIVVTVREGLTEEQQYRYAIVDNQAGKTATFDAEAIENIRLKRGISTEGIFSDKEIEALSKKKEEKPQFVESDDSTVGDVGFYIIVQFENEEERDHLFQELADEDLKVVKYEAEKRGGPGR